MALTTAERTNIIKLVVGMFNAAPGATYLADLTVAYEANGRSLANLARDLSNTTAYKTLNPVFQTATEFAAALLTPYGLQANTVAVDFVTAKFNAGVNKGQIALDVAVALTNTTATEFADAKAILDNKTSAAEYYSVTLAAAVTSISTLQQSISTVTKDAATVASTNTANASGSAGGSGTTFTLTTAAETISGTSGNDTINGYIDAAGTTDTLTGADVINGGAGTDTLNLTIDGAAAGSLPGAAITGVENFKIREVGGTAGTYDFAAVTGETSVVNNISTDAITVNNLAAGTSLTILGDNSTTHGGTIFTLAAATDAVTINIEGGVKGGTITRNATGAATVVINSTGVANTTGVIDVDTATAVKGLTINAAANLTASLAADYAAASTLTVTGAATLVNLSGAALSANFSKVDASAMTVGGVSVIVDQTDTTVDTQFIGGKGADTLDVGKVVYSSTTLTAVGGDGTDTIKMSDQAALTSTTVKNITGFETLSLTDDNDGALDTFDASLITGLTAITLAADSAGDGYSITNLSAAQANAITISGTQVVAPTFGVTNASVVNNLDTLGVTISDGSATVNTITLADVNAAGVETINFTLTDNLTVTAATGLGAMTKLTATGAGNLSLTTGALALNVNSLIDASASTGTVTIDASAGTTNGLAIKGSATKANTITGTNQNDAITGGTAVDTVKNQANAATDADTLDFVVDTAADIFEVAFVTGRTTISNFDVATTTTTEDLVNVSADTVDGGEVVVTGAGAQAAITDDRTYVIEQTVGAAGSLTTGGTATLALADFTAATLTNVAAFLAERYTTTNDTNTDALFILNNGTNTYMYAHVSSAGNTTIDAAELVLVGVVNAAVLNNGDVYQTV